MSAQPALSPQTVVSPRPDQTPANQPARNCELGFTPFDQPEYRRLTEARGETVRRVVNRLKPLLVLSTAIDTGCAVGFFSQLLCECGLAAAGFDARPANIAEARRRYPAVPFEVGNLEDANITQAGRFDLVLCCGLLYHLENPLRAIRNLRQLTGKCLLLESMCVPETRAEWLLRDEPRQEDQSLAEIACYPSETALVKMLYHAGFAAVYRVLPLPDHDDFRETNQHARRRAVLLASNSPIDIAGFCWMAPPDTGEDPWAKQPGQKARLPRRIANFWLGSWRTKYLTLALRARKHFPAMPIPLRLPFGAWWLAEGSALDHELMYQEFEAAEMRFVERFLQPGMTVVDAGAHHGLYTLLASKRAGKSGKVLAIEPSARECLRLRRHLRVNRCRNVVAEECALGECDGSGELHVVKGEHDWCNSLRTPQVDGVTELQRVPLRRLDDMAHAHGIAQIDFLKLDVEGAELSVLRGMGRLLEAGCRPVILGEVQDARTASWGYASREILEYLAERGFRWFRVSDEGKLTPLRMAMERCDGNFVAVSEERLADCQSYIAESAAAR